MAVSGVSAVPVEDTAIGQITTEAAVATTYDGANTEAIVREYFSDIPVMIQVARCESTFRHTLADGSVLRGVVDNDTVERADSTNKETIQHPHDGNDRKTTTRSPEFTSKIPFAFAQREKPTSRAFRSSIFLVSKPAMQF